MIGAHTARALVHLGHEVDVTTHRRGEVRNTGFAPALDVATAVADYVAWRADDTPMKEQTHA